MTHYTAADVALAARHIAEGEAQVVRQELLLTRLVVDNQATDTAQDLLKQLRTSLAEHRKHHAAIVAALEEARGPTERPS